MDEKIKATIIQRLERLPDETARQLLDYIEFLESKYNRSTRDRSPLERLADNVEGTLRASRIGGAAIKGTAQVLDAASSVVRGVADAGRVVVEELQRLDISEDAKSKRPETTGSLGAEKTQGPGQEAERRTETGPHAEAEAAPEAEAEPSDVARQSAEDASHDAGGAESASDEKGI